MRSSTWRMLSAALLVSACAPKGSVPGDAQILCASGADCPSGWLCEEFWGRCVNRSAPGTPPAVTSHTVSLALGRIEVTVDVDRELATPPRVVLRTGETEALVLTLGSRTGNRYAYAGVLTPSIGDGAHELVADLLDVRGREARGVILRTVTLDFSPPSLRSASVVEGRLVEGKAALRAGASATVEVLFSEPLPAAPVASAGGHEMTTIATSEPDRWRFRVLAQGDEPPGTAPISIRTWDASGNEALLGIDGLFRFDFGTPALDPQLAPSVSPAVVRLGQTVYVSFSLSEPGAIPPVVELVPVAGGTPIAMVDDQTHLGAAWRYFHTVQASNLPGTYEVRLSAFEDDAGNPGPPATLGAVVIDATAPVSARPEPTRPDATYRAGDVVQVRLLLDADVATTPSGWLDTRPPVAFACTAAAVREFLCETVAPLAGTERPEGTVAVILNVTDSAGYRSLASTAVTLDFTAPRLASARVVGAQTRFRLGDVVRLEATFTEPLARPPEARLVPGPILTPAATAVQNVWQLTTVVTVATPEGLADLRVTRAEDGAGNADPAGAGTVLGLVTVDRTPPVLSDPGVSTSTAGSGMHVVAQFLLSEPVSTPPRVDAVPSAGGPDLALRLVQRGDLVAPWSYELVVPQDAVPGQYTVRASGIVDDAGNPGVPADLGGVWIPPPGGAATFVVSATGPYRAGELVDARLDLAIDPAVAPSGRLETSPPIPMTCALEGPLSWRCITVTPLTGGEVPEGTVAVRLEFVDGNGQPAAATTPVTLDFTPPAVTLAGAAVTPAVAGGGAVVSVTFPVTEELAGAPAVSAWPVVDATPLTLRLVAPGGAGVPWSYALDVPVDVVAADYLVRVDQLVDRAGNSALDPTPIGTVTLAPRPVLASVTALRTPPSYRAGDIVAVQVSRSSPGLAPTAELATAVPVAMSCVAAGTDTWTCETPPLSGVEGEGAFDVRVAIPDPPLPDDLRTVAVGLDFTAPAVLSPSVSFTPPPGSPLPAASFATGGSTVTVSFVASEPLAVAPTVQVTTPESLAFALVSGPPVGSAAEPFVYAATLAPGAHVDGAWDIEAGLEDLAGNLSTVVLLGTSVGVDTTPPAPPAVDTPGLVVLHRAPAGAVYGLPPSVRGGPGATEGGALVFALAGPDVASAVEVASAGAAGDGSFAIDLGPGFDASELWVVAMDLAGNASTALASPARVRDVAWTIRPGVEGLLRPRMEARPALGALEDPDVTVVTSSPELAAPDQGKLLGAGGQSRWVVSTPVGTAAAPGLPIVAGAVYDPAAGALAILDWSAGTSILTWTGGAWSQLAAAPSFDTIEASVYDTVREQIVGWACGAEFSPGPTLAWPTGGAGWVEVATSVATPPCATPAAMAFDEARGTAVWWGSSATLGSATWEWDGQAWTQFDPLGVGTYPPFNFPSAMAYDAARGRVVLFRNDPLEQVWEFDGVQWVPVTPTVPRPSVFSSLRLSAAPYPGGGIAVLDDLALSVWDGAGFTTIDAALPVSGWAAPILVRGPRPGTLVVVQGNDGAQPVMAPPQVYDGVGWSALEWRWDAPRADARLVYNPGLGRIQALDAGPIATPLRTWADGWSAGDPLPIGTTFLGDAAIAASPGGAVLVFGGLRGELPTPTVTDELWTWAPGAGWTLATQVGSPVPAARSGAALAWDPVASVFVMYGGTGGDQGLWLWDGLFWTLRAPLARAAAPSPMFPALAVDPTGRRWILEGPVAWWWDDVVPAWRRVDALPNGPAYDDRIVGIDAQENVVLVLGKDASGATRLWGFDYLATRWTQLLTPAWGVAALADVAWNAVDRSLVALDAGGSTHVARVESGVAPAYVLRVPTRGAGLVLDAPCPPGSCTILGVDVHWRGEAWDSSVATGLQGGGELLVWNGTGWQLLGETFAVADPLDTTTSDAALLRRIFVGADATLNLAWRPAIRGSPTPRPDELWHATQVGMDYAECTVRYRLP